MKLPSVLVILSIVASVSSCSPKLSLNFTKTYPPVSSVSDVAVIDVITPLPQGAERIGTLERNGTAGYDELAEEVRAKAWRAGGNLVQVRSYQTSAMRSDVHYMVADVYRVDEGYVKVETEPEKPSLQLGNLACKVFAGYGRRMSRVNPDLNRYESEHQNRMFNGVLAGSDITYYFEGGYGAGLRYQIMRSGASSVGVNGVLNEKTDISFIGPIFSYRSASANGRHIMTSNIGLGLMRYNDVRKSDAITEKRIGHAFGETIDINYSYLVCNHFSIGADFNYTGGIVRKLDLSDGRQSRTIELDKDSYEGLAHLGFLVVCTFSF